MSFKNYCVVILGDTTGSFEEIKKIAETPPNVLDGKGILISTFTSLATVRELNDYFKLNGCSFLLFDLNPDYSGCFIAKENINEGLFGFLKTLNDKELKNKTEELIKEISATTIVSESKKNIKRTNRRDFKIEKKIKEEDIDKMSKYDKNVLFNNLLDKGAANLSEHDKKILQKLAN